MTEADFLKGQSGNLPLVDMFMVTSYIQNIESFSFAEVRGVKAKRSGRHSYGDSAIGWVQVRRAKNVCTVKAKVTPEHNVSKKQYAITCNIDEECEKVLDVQCHDCAASSGGCKHAIAFLMWLHRRSEEPSPTEAVCYWAKSKLSKVGTSIKFLTLQDFGAEEESSLFLQEVVGKGLQNKSESQLLKHFNFDGVKERIGLYLKFANIKDFLEGEPEYAKFVEFCSEEMDTELCSEAAVVTTEQSNSGLWFELRYGRITASKIYDAAHCKKSDGSFVNQILGVTKLPSTEAMYRGKNLEPMDIIYLKKN